MPRNKKTEPAKLADVSALPELTGKQHAFVRGLVEGKTKSDAYRAAYDVQNMKADDIHRDACVLSHHPKIVQWLEAYRLAAMDEHRDSVETWLAQGRRLMEMSIASGNLGAAVAQHKANGQVQGFFVERFQDVTPLDKMSDDDLDAQIIEMARARGIDPASLARTKH